VAVQSFGSLGNETTLFGPLTQSALIRFQKENNIVPAFGYFGPLTRTFIEVKTDNVIKKVRDID
jgi:peptidoglycan hydrolase-like protein with peptidoglycan-binding domain